jgi:hypothetical protein
MAENRRATRRSIISECLQKSPSGKVQKLHAVLAEGQMSASDFFMWGERGLVATFFADLHLWDEPEAFDSFLATIEIDSPLFPRKAKKITCIAEPDFGNAGFGHPDAVLRVEAENDSYVIIVEAKRHPYTTACKPISLRGIDRSGFNSSLNGQLELDFALAAALEQFKLDDQKLIEPEWITKTPYALERGSRVRRVLKNRNVLRDVVPMACGLPFENYFFVSLTTDMLNPFDAANSLNVFPELFHPQHGPDNCWGELKHQFGWVNYLKLERVIRSLFDSGNRRVGSLFLESLKINENNMRSRAGSEPSNDASEGVKTRGSSMIYSSQINPKTYLHFSWLGQGCALRDYSLSAIEQPEAVRSYRTSQARILIEQELRLGRLDTVRETSRLHERTMELNKQLVARVD